MDIVLGRKGVRLVRAVAEVGPHVGELAGESPLLRIKFRALIVSLRVWGGWQVIKHADDEGEEGVGLVGAFSHLSGVGVFILDTLTLSSQPSPASDMGVSSSRAAGDGE